MSFSLSRLSTAFRNESARPLFSMAAPIMTEQALITLLALVNAGMAGKAGTAVASGVGLVNAITALMNSIFSALALGGTVAVSRALGSGRRDAADSSALQCVLMAICSSTLIALTFVVFSRGSVNLLFGASPAPVRDNAAAYLLWSAVGFPFLAFTLASSGILRGAGKPRTPMLVNVLMNLVNVLAGRVFIFGLVLHGTQIVPPLGAAGAGIAVSLARAVGSLIYVGSFLSPSSVLNLRFKRKESGSFPVPWFRRWQIGDRVAAASVLSIGVPAAVESLAFNGGKLLTQTYVAGLGASAVASDYLANAAAGLAQVPLVSLQLAVPPLVGAALGRGSAAQAKSIVATAVLWGSLISVFIDAPGFFFARQYLALSSNDPQVLAKATTIFRLFCVMTPLLWAPSFVVPAGLRGAGDGRFTMIIAVISMWTVRVCLGWFLSIPMGLGILGVWIAMIADWLVRSACFVPRLRGDAWIRRA